jgi:hypothetical protein
MNPARTSKRKTRLRRCGYNAAVTAWVLCWMTAAGAEPAAKEPAPPGEPVAVEVRGRLVCLAEALHERFGTELPTGHAHVPGFVTRDRRYYTLLRTSLSESLFADPALNNRELLVKARLLPNSQVLDVTLIRSVHDGVIHDLYYWCDICAIKSVVPGACMCCQADVELTEVPLSPPDPNPPDQSP